MNSWYEWTALRETTSFYGVAHDSTPVSRKGRLSAVRATVPDGFTPPEADRQIGVWCIRR